MSALPVIDSHVHIFPAEVIEGRDAFIERDPWFGQLYRNPKGALADADALIAAMDNARVDYAVVCGFPWADAGICRFHNDAMADACRRYPGRLSWLGIVVPQGREAVAETERCFALGAVGIGELNADAQGFDWRDTPVLRAFVDSCLEADKPILLHASEPAGHSYPGKGIATPDKLIAFLSEFRALRVVAAHWGGGLPFLELMPEISTICANVVYDCAASTYLYRPAIFRSVLDVIGQERVLFGSDYPVLRMDRFLNRVRELDWRNEDEAAAVLAGNARQVFGINLRTEHDQ